MTAVMSIAKKIINKSLRVCTNLPCLPALINWNNKYKTAIELTTKINTLNIKSSYNRTNATDQKC